MTVAGYSLGAIYGAHPRVMTVPSSIAMGRDRRRLDPRHTARHPPALRAQRRFRHRPARILDDDYAPLAIEVPTGTRATLAAGRSAALVLYVDPARRLEVNALEPSSVSCSASRRRGSRPRATGARRERARVRHALVQLERAPPRAPARRPASRPPRTTRCRGPGARRDAMAHSRRRRGARACRRRRTPPYATNCRREAALARRRKLDALAAARPDFERWLALRAKAGSHAAKFATGVSREGRPPDRL